MSQSCRWESALRTSIASEASTVLLCHGPGVSKTALCRRCLVARCLFLDRVTGPDRRRSPSVGGVNKASTSSVSLGIRPDHLSSVDYVKLLWSDTGAVLAAPAHWDKLDWMYAGFAAASIGAAASLDNTIKDNVQAHRTTGEDRFFNQCQNLGAAWSFGVIGAFEIWGYY